MSVKILTKASKSTQNKTAKKSSLYTRISISSGLAKAVADVQKEYPLYSLNDAIYLLLNLGFKDFNEKNTVPKSKGRSKFFEKYKQINFSNTKSKNTTTNEELYSDYYDGKYKK